MSKVHTNNNACLTVFGLALGGRDVTNVIGNTVAMGMDNDCTAATAGSIVGAVVGIDSVPEHWFKPFRNKTRSYLTGHEWFRHNDLVRRFTRCANTVWSTAGAG
jgi:ADP-ribosylglycohydrolase